MTAETPFLAFCKLEHAIEEAPPYAGWREDLKTLRDAALRPVADEDLEDDVWSAIMEAEGPDSGARDYAKAAIAAMIERGLVRAA